MVLEGAGSQGSEVGSAGGGGGSETAPGVLNLHLRVVDAEVAAAIRQIPPGQRTQRIVGALRALWVGSDVEARLASLDSRVATLEHAWSHGVHTGSRLAAGTGLDSATGVDSGTGADRATTAGAVGGSGGGGAPLGGSRVGADDAS